MGSGRLAGTSFRRGNVGISPAPCSAPPPALAALPDRAARARVSRIVLAPLYRGSADSGGSPSDSSRCRDSCDVSPRRAADCSPLWGFFGRGPYRIGPSGAPCGESPDRSAWSASLRCPVCRRGDDSTETATLQGRIRATTGPRGITRNQSCAILLSRPSPAIEPDCRSARPPGDPFRHP